MSTDVFITAGGNVTWLSAAIFKSSCQMDVQYYPFDAQVRLPHQAGDGGDADDGDGDAELRDEVRLVGLRRDAHRPRPRLRAGSGTFPHNPLGIRLL